MKPPSFNWHSAVLLIIATVTYCQQHTDCARDLTTECPKPDEFVTGEGDVTLKFQVYCGGQPYYGAYVQLVDYFQAVNDVIAHGHTDLDGNVHLAGKFFFYSDSDLPPPRYEYKIIVYHYCKVNSDRKNQCHQVGTYTSTIGCTKKNVEILLKMNCLVAGTKFYKLEGSSNADRIDIEKDQKLVCLDGVST
uniref:ZP domain-containing protein n=1 Tax=Panagrellus redivivus TaxID=6233 RepID=A0A7E4VUZ9_PANRE